MKRRITPIGAILRLNVCPHGVVSVDGDVIGVAADGAGTTHASGKWRAPYRPAGTRGIPDCPHCERELQLAGNTGTCPGCGCKYTVDQTARSYSIIEADGRKCMYAAEEHAAGTVYTY